jgi:preprotein translocase subunit SecG
VFGARGSGSFLTRTTAILATIFFLTSMALAYYATKGAEPPTLMDAVDDATVVIPGPVPSATDVPMIPGAAPVQSAPSDVPLVTIAPEPEGVTGSDADAAGSMAESVAADESPEPSAAMAAPDATMTVAEPVEVEAAAEQVIEVTVPSAMDSDVPGAGGEGASADPGATDVLESEASGGAAQ